MNISDLERNELQFFSLWSQQKVSANLIILYNTNLREDPLFNHAALKNMVVLLTQEDLEYVKSFYTQLNIRPALFLIEEKYSNQQLLESGFKAADKLLTLAAPTSSRTSLNSNIKISTCNADDLEDWIKVFIDAFSTPQWFNELRKITANLIKHPSCTLYIARRKNTAVGVAARYHSENLSGIYCLGIIPQLRNRGVGSTLIRHLINEAYKEGDQKVCLQTLLSENLTGFYTKVGFKKVYEKVIYVG